MKKIILIISLFACLSLCQAQESWEKIDTCRVWVFISDTSIKIEPDVCECLNEDFWNVLLCDKIFKHVEEVRETLKPFEFESTKCYLDTESDLLVFCFEKVTIESETIWRKEL